MGESTLKHVLATALGEVGYHESPAGSNHTKFGKWYPMDGQPWCAMFVSWDFKDGLDSIGGKFARTDTKAKAMNNSGHFHKGASGMKTGDVVFFNFGVPHNGNRFLGIVHVGICLGRLADGRYKTVEGNTSSTSNANGGAVEIRYRSSAMIAGYYRPHYAAAVKPPVVKKPVAKPKVTTHTMKVTAKSGLRIRSGAGTKYKVLGALPYGTKVSVVSTSKGWRKIKFKKGYGYGDSTYIK